MQLKVYGYILVMAGVTYLIRLLPLTLLQRPIKNRFVRLFLYYVPYVTLAVMTFPAILDATNSPLSAWIGFVTAAALALAGKGLFTVSILACAAVFLAELVLL